MGTTVETASTRSKYDVDGVGPKTHDTGETLMVPADTVHAVLVGVV